MRRDISPDTVREAVIEQFTRQCVAFRAEPRLSERVRTERGRTVARSYQGGTLMAMWMVDIGLLQFYDGAGNMLQTWSLLAAPAPHRKAA